MPWKDSKAMIFIWTGSLILGVVYLIAFQPEEPEFAFVVGQITMAAFGLMRELHLKAKG
ncbi:hypothetical protein [Marinobacterium sp. BA1]|uniref:hypothetical protein n=1 Tax=Marinobacterium sp. BA1 TaxID=3138931 RepID=UPI0032E71AFA